MLDFALLLLNLALWGFLGICMYHTARDAIKGTNMMDRIRPVGIFICLLIFPLILYFLYTFFIGDLSDIFGV